MSKFGSAFFLIGQSLAISTETGIFKPEAHFPTEGALQPVPLTEKILVCSCKLCNMTELS